MYSEASYCVSEAQLQNVAKTVGAEAFVDRGALE